MAGESMEPPLVCLVEANIRPLLDGLAQAQAAIRALAGDDPQIQITATIGDLLRKAAEARAVIESIPDADVDVDAGLGDLMANLAAAKAELADLAAMKADPQVGVEGMAPAMFDLEALRAQVAALNGAHAWIRVDATGVTSASIEMAALKGATGGGGGGGLGAFWSLLSGGKGGEGGGIGGLLTTLGWGSGALGGAGFGSLLDFAGLGVGHLALTGVGLAGSAAGGALGGGLPGLGALAVMGTGMLTDLAGIGQAAGDIKNTYSAMTALSTAVSEYGKNSNAARQAQIALNNTLTSFSPVARGAVSSAAQLAIHLKAMFDAATGLAEKGGAQIISEIMRSTEPFISVIGAFAAQNMQIILRDIRPLLAWLDTGGLDIFRTLNGLFQQQLPTAIAAFSQAIKFFLTLMSMAAQYTGGFVKSIDDFFTKLNRPGDMEQVRGVVATLINDFHLWLNFAIALGEAIYNLFHDDAHTAQAIISYLTTLLHELSTYLATTGRAQVHSIFEVHKNEILELIAVAVRLVKVFATIYDAIGPPLVRAVTLIATAFVDLFDILQRNPITKFLEDWGLGLVILNSLFFRGTTVARIFMGAIRLLGSAAAAVFGLFGIDLKVGVLAPLARAALDARAFAGEALVAGFAAARAGVASFMSSLYLVAPELLVIRGILSELVFPVGFALGISALVNELDKTKGYTNIPTGKVGPLTGTGQYDSSTGSYVQFPLFDKARHDISAFADTFSSVLDGARHNTATFFDSVGHEVGAGVGAIGHGIFSIFNTVSSSAASASSSTHRAAQATDDYATTELRASEAARAYHSSLANAAVGQQAILAAMAGTIPRIAQQASSYLNAAAAAKTYNGELGLLTGGVNRIMNELTTQASSAAKLAGKAPQEMITAWAQVPGALQNVANRTPAEIKKIVQATEQLDLFKESGSENAKTFGNSILTGLTSSIPGVSGGAILVAKQLNITPQAENWGKTSTLQFLEAIVTNMSSGNTKVRNAADALAANANIHALMVKYGLTSGTGFGDSMSASLRAAGTQISRTAAAVGREVEAALRRAFNFTVPGPHIGPTTGGGGTGGYHRGVKPTQYGGDLLPGMMAWVGEVGPELINIGRYGGSVATNAQSMHGAAQNISISPTIVVLDGQTVGRIVWGYAREEALRTTVRQTRTPFGLGPHATCRTHDHLPQPAGTCLACGSVEREPDLRGHHELRHRGQDHDGASARASADRGGHDRDRRGRPLLHLRPVEHAVPVRQSTDA